MKARLWVPALVIVCTIGVDRGTKHVAKSHLMKTSRITLLSDTIRLQYVENEGAFLGLGGRLSPSIRFWLFTVGNGALLFWIALLIGKSRSRPPSEIVGWSLIWSGGVSNFVDRVFQDGRVVDFLNLGIGPLRTGIFNAADVAIVAGLAILLLRWFWRKPHMDAATGGEHPETGRVW